MHLPSFVLLNCLGVGSATAVRHMLELIKAHKLSILILMETRASRSHVDNIINQSYFTNCLVFEASSFSGGIWIF